MSDSSVPLCLCLDGTLTPVCIADERRVAAARQAPYAFLEAIKRRIEPQRPARESPAARALIDAPTLPLRLELVEWLRRQRAAGRRLVLLADGDPIIAQQVAAHLQLFDEVTTTSSFPGTPAERRRSALIARFGEHGFDYIGSDAADDGVWNASRQAIVVGNASVGRGIDRDPNLVEVIPSSGGSLRAWIKAIRLHQWAKNGLIFVPALLAHAIAAPRVLIDASMAFVAFGLCASSVYLINDLFDLVADRQHPRKRLRPFAAGTLSTRSGLGAAALLISAAAVIALMVGERFSAVLLGYYVLTWAYSVYLKRVPLLDVMMLAALYTLRIIAGAAATQIPLSFWLLAFSVFIFLSLGFVKRYAELDDARKGGELVANSRGYRATDLPLIMSLGTASGYSAIVVMALYINSADSQSLYQHHKPLWLICPVMLFWISRIWILTTRGVMHDDPVVFALRDRMSLAILLVLAAIVLASI